MKLCLEEEGSIALREYLESRPRLVSSEIVRVEVLRAIGRGSAPPAAAAEAEAHLAAIQLVRLDVDQLARAARLGPPELRTLDAIHLAAALSVGQTAGDFLCYDRRLGRAARRHGFRVLAPGQDEVHEPAGRTGP